MKPLDLREFKVCMTQPLFPLITDEKPIKWLCKCDCGKEFVAVASDIKRGNYKSCGCKRKMLGKKSESWRGVGDISGNAWAAIKASARFRGYEFKITIEDAWKKFQEQRGICALSGTPITLCDSALSLRKNRSLRSASLDRIDSTRGYVDGNIQWVHKKINKMKWSLTDEEFIAWCHLVSNHNYEPTNKQTGS